MEPETLLPFGPPFYPANVEPGLWAPKSYLKSSKFTQSILTHGRWSNTTLDEATNLRKREHQLKERTMREMARMSDKFRWEVQEVERIQKQVRARQHRIAQANLCACCAIMIQAAWRTYQAKILARQRRGQKLSQILARWWRYVKTRRNLAILKRFVKAAVSRRRQRAHNRLIASVKVQRAWRRYMLRMILGRVVLATAATEILMEDILVELARRVYIEIKGAVIVKAWKKSKRRLESKSRKGRSGRVFLTQGGASSPRRKPARAGGSRNGLTSDPSSPSASRRSPSIRPNKANAGMAAGYTPPAILSIVSAATSTAAAATTAGDGEHRSSSQATSDPTPPSPSKDDASHASSRREKSGASATSETEGDNGSGGTRGRPKPVGSSTLLATQLPDEGVRKFESPESEPRGSSGGAGGGGGRLVGGRNEDVVVGVALDRKPSLHERKDVVPEKTTMPQPRRPSGEKPSRTSEGRSGRPHIFSPGRDNGSPCPPSTTPNDSGPSLQCVAAGKQGTATGSLDVPAEVTSATAVADARRDSKGHSGSRGGGVAGWRLDEAGLRDDGFGDDDDLGHRDKVSSLVGGSELGKASIDKEDYASDTWESFGELSLTQ